jgi:hypothetical protein
MTVAVYDVVHPVTQTQISFTRYCHASINCFIYPQMENKIPYSLPIVYAVC